MKHSELRHQPRHVNPRIQDKIRAECELYCFDNMVLQQVIREWRLG